MRKQVTGEMRGQTAGAHALDLDAVARVEVSSEAAGSPIEGALTAPYARPWRAARPGKSVLTLRFDQPQRVGQVRLRCVDTEHERSQEWALVAVLEGGQEREVLRQGWNFSPGGSTEQDETYTLNLSGVAGLRLAIDPDRGRDRYPASLALWEVSAG